MNQSIHFVDAMRYLGGKIVEVKFTLARDSECEEIGSDLFSFEFGALGSLFVTIFCRYDQKGAIMILGEKRQVKLGDTCLRPIQNWDFDKLDLEMAPQARSSEYTSDSVYGFGHGAFYLALVTGSLHSYLKGAHPVESLETLLSIYDRPPSIDVP